MLLFSLVYFPSRGSLIDVFIIGHRKRPWCHRKGGVCCKEPGKIKRKEKGNVSVLIGSSRIVDIVLIMPPSFPMVFLVRNYVRVVHMPQFGGS